MRAFRTAVRIAVVISLLDLAAGLARAEEPGRQLSQASDQPAAAGTPAPPAVAPAPPPAAAPAPPPAATPAPEAPAAAAVGTPATVLDDQQVVTVLGRSVRGREGEDMGRIVDVIVNRAGQVRAAVIDFGGFLGVGSRKVAVDWRALRFEPTGKPDHITLDLTRNSVRLAPEYKEGSPVVVLGTPEASQPTNGSASKDASK
ncbi:MAG TPA: PRC-barrel domain-containing protein [Xanthobacteraceae bacterium]|nr:PRC-barrel domain-containing protein [Xanthobacteraceae bacterium]